MSRLGVVASGHPEVTRAAIALLEAGGNAFDAVVTAGFVSAVAEPALTSLGGGGFLLARSAQGRAVLFDFFVDTPGEGLPARELEPHFLPVTVHFPASDQVFNVGLGSVAVPGTLRGLLHVQGRLGRLPLREVLAPAIRLAREGVVLNASQAYFLELLNPITTLSEAGRAIYQPDGVYVREGSLLRNAALADFLDTVASEGARELYEGALARRIARDMHEGGGLLTETDLRRFEVIEREPLQASYRGRQLLTNPAPSFGGSLVALSLRLLETGDPKTLGFGSAQHLTLLAAVMQEVDRRRDAAIRTSGQLDDSSIAESLTRVRSASGGTTHVSVSDGEGNVASMTTSNGEGSGYLVPGTGIMLNNMLGEDDLYPDGFHTSPPGQRVASMMCPSLLLEDGVVRLVLGSGGSKRIRTALLQVISNFVDFERGLRAAVDAPRLHWDGEALQVEPGFAVAALDALRGRWRVNAWPVIDVYFGGVHVAAPAGEAAGDPRRGGSHAVVRLGREA